MTLLVYAAVASGLLWLAVRAVLAIGLPARLVLLAMPLCFTGAALVTDAVYAPIGLPYNAEPLLSARAEHGIPERLNAVFSDVHSQFIPWRKAVRWALAQGEWPLWNPFMLCGDPLAASAIPAPFYPLWLPGYLLPLPQSLTYGAAISFFLAGLCAFLYLRDVGCREGAALVGAAGWMYSSYLAFWLEWPQTPAAAVLPLVFLGVRRALRSPGLPALFLLAAGFVLTLLAGHPETSFHVVAVGLAYAACEAVLGWPRRPWAAAATGVGAGVLALLLCAIQLLPFLEALPQTREYHDRQKYLAGAHRSEPWPAVVERLEPSAVPFVHGIFGREETDVPVFHRLPSTAYAGSVLFAPALFGLCFARWRGRWALLALGALGLLAGVAAPGVTELLGRLPLFSIALNDRLVLVAAFALAALAALGAEAWAESPRPRLLGAFAAGVLAALAAGVWWLWPEMRGLGLSREFLAGQTALLLVPPGLLAILAVSARSATVCLAGLLGLLLAQRTAEMGRFYPTHPARAFYPVVAPLDALPRGGDPYRIVGVGLTFLPNGSALYELEDPRGYQAMTFARLAATFPLWSIQQPVWFNRVDDLERPFLSLMNVRYAIAPRSLRPPPGWRRVGRGPGSRLLENTRALPRAFVPRRVRLGGPDEWALAEMRREDNFRRRAWIAAPGTEGWRRPKAFDNGPGTVSIAPRGSGYELEAEMKRPSWVVVSVTAWKGWRALAAGRELPIAFANHAFLGLHLPAGRHRVSLVYRPRSFEVGRALTFGTMALLAAAAVARRVRHRAARRG